MTRSRTVRFPLLLMMTLAGLAVLSLFAPFGWWSGLTRWQVDERAAIEFFQREPLSFLVTERIVTQVVVEKHEGNLLMGAKDGFLFGTVELLYGVDLASLAEDAVRLVEHTIRVAVPEPELLRAVPDLDSVRFLQKRTPMIVLADKLLGEDFYTRCLLELDDAAIAFVSANDLAPTREQLIKRLNGYAPVIAARIGAEVVFE